MIRVEQNERDYVCHLKPKLFSLIMSLLFGTAILALPLNSIAKTVATKKRMRIELNKRESARHLKRKPFSLILSLLFVAGILSLPLNSLATTNVTKEHPVNFNQAISPILSKHCLECHGPDANQRKARFAPGSL